MLALVSFALLAAAEPIPSSWQQARDAQDRAALDRLSGELQSQAQAQPNDASMQYRAALLESLRAEVLLELRDRGAAKAAAEAGIRAAERAVALTPKSSEYHRVLGTLCGQVIPANVLAGLRYGKCAQEEVNRAIELDPKSALAHMARGVGNYYLPEAFGGGAEIALKDFAAASKLDPRNGDIFLWMGITLRKLNRNAEARQALSRAIALNPNRIWAKQQLEKTPAK